MSGSPSWNLTPKYQGKLLQMLNPPSELCPPETIKPYNFSPTVKDLQMLWWGCQIVDRDEWKPLLKSQTEIPRETPPNAKSSNWVAPSWNCETLQFWPWWRRPPNEPKLGQMIDRGDRIPVLKSQAEMLLITPPKWIDINLKNGLPLSNSSHCSRK